MKNNENTFLVRGNAAFRVGNFYDAFSFYEKALKDSPQLKDICIFNMALTRAKAEEQLISVDRINREAAGLNKKDVVMFWKQNDTGLYGRRHEMMAKNIKDLGYVRNLIIVDAPVPKYRIERKLQDGTLTHHQAIYSAVCDKSRGKFYMESIPVCVGVEKKLDFSTYKEYLQKLFNRFLINTGQSIFWFYPKVPFDMEIIAEFKPAKVVVDIVDDHRTWPGIDEKERETLTENYRNILSVADIALANCQSTQESMKEFHHDIRLVPNGCETDPQIHEPIDDENYQRLKRFDGKIIGFVGNLESKIDLELIEKLSKQFCDDLIVLVGSTHTNPEARQLQNLPNVIMTGPIAYEFVNAFMKLFTVGIVPHHVTSLTDNMNPLKVYVYAANKIPVVCTHVKNIPQAEFIYVANSHEEFIDYCDSILSGRHPYKKENFDRFIEDNSWACRVKLAVQGLWN